MKKTTFPRRFVVASNYPIQWEWESICQYIKQTHSVYDMLHFFFTKNFIDGWNRHKRNLIWLNSEDNSLKWYGGLNEILIHKKLQRKNYSKEILFRPLIKKVKPQYDFLVMVKNAQNEMGILYIGDKFLVPEVHFKVHSQFFAIAHLFGEGYEPSPMPAPYVSGKLLFQKFNLLKAFYDYHQKIHHHLPQYFSIGIDYKNRVLDYSKNQDMHIYHWADNQKLTIRKSHERL